MKDSWGLQLERLGLWNTMKDSWGLQHDRLGLWNTMKDSWGYNMSVLVCGTP
jgi:hypothetical protein